MTDVTFRAVFFDDRFVPPGDPAATIPITAPGYLLGEGVFATMRAYRGTCFRHARHLATLARGAALFGIELPYPLAQLGALADEAAARSGAAAPYVRVTVTRRSESSVGLVTILAREMDVPDDAAYARGIAVTVVSARRIPPACVDPTVKSTSYAPAVLARREARERTGHDDGLQLALDGSFACGTMANLFTVSGDRLVTPPLDTGCRAGVTREAILELAASVGLHAHESTLTRADLDGADEVFLSSTRVECLPVASIDGQSVGRARFPRTAALRAALHELAAREADARRA